MEPDAENESVTVTLRFKNRDDRHHFMGGLTDGWGENACDLHWGQERGVMSRDADTFDVTMWSDEEDKTDGWDDDETDAER